MRKSLELKQKADALRSKVAVAMAKPELTAEELTAADKDAKDMDVLLTQASQYERLENMDAGREAAAAPTRAALVEVREAFENDPKGGFDGHRDFLGAVMNAGMGTQPDKRLAPWKAPRRATVGSDEQGAYDDAYGGYLIPTAIAPGILSVGPGADPLIGLLNNIPMTSPHVTFNARVDKNHATSVAGGLVFRRRTEVEQAESGRMEFEQVEMNAHELTGLAYATEFVLMASPQSFVALLSNGFADALTDKRMRERLRGSGTGAPLGVLSLATTQGTVEIAKETGQAATSIVTENIDKMAARCWMYSRAVWLANQTTRPQLRALTRTIGTGGELARLFTNEGGRELLDGRPIFFSEYCSALGTVGDLLLGVWSEYLYGVYQPLQRAESIHVRFEYNERAFKFWMMDDGQPWWRTVLTPYAGDTLAPFVRLATRA